MNRNREIAAHMTRLSGSGAEDQIEYRAAFIVTNSQQIDFREQRTEADVWRDFRIDDAVDSEGKLSGGRDCHSPQDHPIGRQAQPNRLYAGCNRKIEIGRAHV